MQDISYDIVINDEISGNQKRIRSKSIRRNISNENILFIPFLNNGEIVQNISVKEMIRSGEYIEKYPYGLRINIASDNDQGIILNSGIRLYGTSIEDVFGMLLLKNKRERSLRFVSNFFVFNFPSNYLHIDVSREKIAGFSKEINKTDFGIKLMNEIKRQIVQYIDLCKLDTREESAINMQSLIVILEGLCKRSGELKHLHSGFGQMRYVLHFEFKEDNINLKVGRGDGGASNTIIYNQDNYLKWYKQIEIFLQKEQDGWELERQLYYMSQIMQSVHELIHGENFFLDEELGGHFYRYRHRYGRERGSRFTMTLKVQNVLKMKQNEKILAYIYISMVLLHKRRENSYNIILMDMILLMLLEQYTMGQIERGECIISVNRDEIKNVLVNLEKRRDSQ